MAVEFMTGYSVPDNLRPYMKPRKLRIRTTGLRPDTDMFIFFNDVDVSEYCRPCTIPAGGSIVDDSQWQITGEIGDTVTSSSDGIAAFYFYVPEKVFLVGSGVLVVKDAVDDTYTTKAEVVYNSLNFPKSMEDQTRIVQVEAATVNRQITNRSNTTGSGFLNPPSQNFFVSSNMARNKEGIFLSSVDLYFSAKDSVYGIVVEIRETENSIPTNNPLPMSRVRLTPDDISITGETHVAFPGLVFLKSGKEYSLTLIPDGGGANYRIHTAAIGSRDSATNEVISRNWGEGNLYLPTNSAEWTPISNEFMKFKLYYAEFTANSGYAGLVNKDYEFLTVANTSGDFMLGEQVAQIGSDLPGVVDANSSSYVLNGSATSFTTTFNANDYITIMNSATDIDVIRIDSIANNTVLTLRKKPSFANSVAAIQKTPVGTVDLFNTKYSQITLVDSTAANSTFVFAANASIVGADSGASATISSVDNKAVNQFQPLFTFQKPADTDLRLQGQVADDSYTIPAATALQLVGTNLIDTRAAVLASRSNEIVFLGGQKSMKMNVALSSTESTLTPLLDLAIPSIVTYGNRVNSNTTNEHTKNGAGQSKFISKTVELKDGLDSDDLVIRLDAWRPPSTDVKIYAKIMSSTDPAVFDDKEWTELEKTTANTLYSDTVNRNDIVEIEYTFPTSPPSTQANGSISVANNSTTVSGSNTTFSTALSVGQLVKIDAGASTQIRRVTAIANNTSMTLNSNSSFTSPTATYSTLATQHTAYKDVNNDYIVRYWGEDGVVYDTYKYFALKILFTSDYGYIAPEVDNIRVISCV